MYNMKFDLKTPSNKTVEHKTAKGKSKVHKTPKTPKSRKSSASSDPISDTSVIASNEMNLEVTEEDDGFHLTDLEQIIKSHDPVHLLGSNKTYSGFRKTKHTRDIRNKEGSIEAVEAALDESESSGSESDLMGDDSSDESDVEISESSVDEPSETPKESRHHMRSSRGLKSSSSHKKHSSKKHGKKSKSKKRHGSQHHANHNGQYMHDPMQHQMQQQMHPQGNQISQLFGAASNAIHPSLQGKLNNYAESGSMNGFDPSMSYGQPMYGNNGAMSSAPQINPMTQQNPLAFFDNQQQPSSFNNNSYGMQRQQPSQEDLTALQMSAFNAARGQSMGQPMGQSYTQPPMNQMNQMNPMNQSYGQPMNQMGQYAQPMSQQQFTQQLGQIGQELGQELGQRVDPQAITQLMNQLDPQTLGQLQKQLMTMTGGANRRQPQYPMYQTKNNVNPNFFFNSLRG